MERISLPEIGVFEAWRDAARLRLQRGVPPSELTWQAGEAPPDLFAREQEATGASRPAPCVPSLPRPTVPGSFVTMARSVVWHRAPDRFDRLYTFLWRLAETPGLIEDPGDAGLARLRQMEKSVQRDQHKMKAFLRFRDITERGAARRRFAAWFEPDHAIVEPTAPFFARRFGDMDWLIMTPGRSARFVDGALSLGPGERRPHLPEDATEDLWCTYFTSIFNPARLKVKAMQSEMPRKYWHNMPEAGRIAGMIAGAEEAVKQMRENAPTQPPPWARRLKEREDARRLSETQERPAGDMDRLEEDIRRCTRCPLHCRATQAVTGEGPERAPLMIVGEQPGDREDLAGRPFIGPAGQLFDRLAAEAGLDRGAAYVTNAVKHFKFAPRGKRRLHQRPNSGEIAACKWWLDQEIALVRPRLVLTLGATALYAVTGDGGRVSDRRGRIYSQPGGRPPIYVTVHPSSLLRLSDSRAQAAAKEAFRTDLRRVAEDIAS